MLDFAIFAVTFVVALVIAVIYLMPGSSKPSTIPGPDPTSKEDGNLQDIYRAGSLHEYLLDLHKQYGPITSFWYGPHFVASIASADLFKQHQHVFDRPSVLYKIFEPLVTKKCIQFANKADGRTRRNNYDVAFSQDCVIEYFAQFQSIADELSKKWTNIVQEEHIPLRVYMMSYSLKAVLITLMGESFKNDEEVLEFGRLYDIVWSELERRLMDTPSPDSNRVEVFDEAKDSIYAMVRRTVENRKKEYSKGDEHLLIDLLIKHSADEDTLICDTLDYIIGGFHTTGNTLTWALYFLATHQDEQQKVHQEIKDVLGDRDVDHNSIGDLVYMRQVIDETLRCAAIAPYASRYQDVKSELGGHKIPKNTPVIHALGVTFQDETLWPLPHVFDPSRFSPENSKDRAEFAFKPFGFAGKRMCPGVKFAYAEATVCLVTLLRKFKVNMVGGQVITPVHGLVTHPSEEVWITIENRDAVLFESHSQTTFSESQSQTEIAGLASQSEFGEPPSQNEMGEVPSQNEFGEVPPQNEFGESASQNEMGEVPFQNDFGEVPLQNDFGAVPIQNEFGEVPIQNEFGDGLYQNNLSELNELHDHHQKVIFENND